MIDRAFKEYKNIENIIINGNGVEARWIKAITLNTGSKTYRHATNRLNRSVDKHYNPLRMIHNISSYATEVHVKNLRKFTEMFHTWPVAWPRKYQNFWILS
jgi:hypothetical protein